MLIFVLKVNSSVEVFMIAVITRHLGLEQQPSPTDDFFEIGGDSLTAAIVISEFRDNPRTNTLVRESLNLFILYRTGE